MPLSGMSSYISMQYDVHVHMYITFREINCQTCNFKPMSTGGQTEYDA